MGVASGPRIQVKRVFAGLYVLLAVKRREKTGLVSLTKEGLLHGEANIFTTIDATCGYCILTVRDIG